MKTLLFILALGICGLFWARERMLTSGLRSQLDLQRREHPQLEAARREHARLLALQPTEAELAELRRATADRTRDREELERAAATAVATLAPTLLVGEWLPPSAWTDCGRSTPASTVQTMLWAAAGGDTARLQAMLQLDEPTQAKLQAVFDKLPESARALYASPAQLIAAFTAKSVPLGDAQLVWENQHAPDQAVACVWIKTPDSSPAAAPSERGEISKADPKAPPMLPPSRTRRQAVLSLKRADDGWRVVVPAHAIDKLARELSP